MSDIVYFDRARGERRVERVWAGPLLHWLYNSRPGALVEAVLSGTAGASRIYGWLQRRAFSRRRIARFVERMEVDLTGSRKRVEDFTSFHEFFTREIDPAARPFDGDPRACLAPADGKVLAYASVPAEAVLRGKRSTFQLARLLGDPALAGRFTGGAVVIVRLTLADYHRFHFPDGGVPDAPRTIPGRYHAGGPYARRWLVPFFTENHRMVTRLVSDHFGEIAMVEIGALAIGSIRQVFRPGERVARGQLKGWFEPGGSTIVMVFAPGRIRIDADLLARSARGEETYLRMGEGVGLAADGGKR